ncbi:CsbD family protein, partial [Streptococcus suis]|nr:CsbD family protein [Streptococcus suis]
KLADIKDTIKGASESFKKKD